MKAKRILIPSTIILVPIIIIAISWNKIYHSEGKTEQVSWEPTYDSIRGNQFIYRFADTVTYEQKQRVFDSLTTKLGQKFIDSCACGNLYLYTYDSIMEYFDGQESRLHESDDEAKEEGGEALYNLGINMDLPFNNKKYYGDTSKICLDLNERKRKVVAVIDGGIANKFDLEQSRWSNKAEAGYGLDGRDQDNNGYIDDVNGVNFITPGVIDPPMNLHGTVVSHILLNSLSGANIDVELMDLRIFNEKGKGSLFHALCAMDYAIRNEADFINMSWGYYRRFSDTSAMKTDSLILEYILKANKSGISVFASAGNSHLDTDTEKLHYPSGFYRCDDPFFPENLISVTALNCLGTKLDPDYANYGNNSVFVATKGTFCINWKIIDGTSYSTPKALAYALTLTNSNSQMSPLELKRCMKAIVDNKSFQIKSKGRIDLTETSCP